MAAGGRMKQNIHTPEGVRDIWGKEYAARLRAEELIRTVFHRYGYQDIRTPSFEFFDVFSREKGSAASRDLFKFFDRDGETMVLRPDMTPAIARFAAREFEEGGMPVRLSYIENMFINRLSLQGRLKEFTQAGAELLDDGSADADAEILALTIDCLLACGLTDFQLEVGHVGFLQGLFAEAGLPVETEEEIYGFLENKNYFGVEEQLARSGIDAERRSLFDRLPGLFASAAQLEEAALLPVGGVAGQAIERLQEVYRILGCYGMQRYVSFDLGMVGGYRYYNGMIFRGYTYGSGEPVATGGRYDNLMEQFGRRARAVGFALVLDSVMAALSRQGIEMKIAHPQTLILYGPSGMEQAIDLACRLRQKGEQVQLQRMEKPDSDSVSGGQESREGGGEKKSYYRKYAVGQGFERLIIFDGENMREERLCDI